MKFLSTLTAVLLLFNLPQDTGIKDLNFLAGTWKVENKENYERWTLKEKGHLEGVAYKVRNGNTQIDENLTIKITGEKVVYSAKVKNQNNGQPIDFVLNKMIKDKFSFENAGHDFPKKIQYTIRNDSTLFVSVLGENDKGFSYNLIKQK